MGTWSTAIDGNDTFQDVYQVFLDKYNEGQDPLVIARDIQTIYYDEINDLDDKHNALFALALALWETKSLDQETLQRVKQIIDSGENLARWKSEQAKSNLLSQRQKALVAFLGKISRPKEKAKRRRKTKYEFKQVFLLKLPAPDGKKIFEISESYTNDTYIQTGSGLLWITGEMQGGGGICYFAEQGRSITARWIDSQTLEIIHDPAIRFTKKETSFYFCGDECQVRYTPKSG